MSELIISLCWWGSLFIVHHYLHYPSMQQSMNSSIFLWCFLSDSPITPDRSMLCNQSKLATRIPDINVVICWLSSWFWTCLTQWFVAGEHNIKREKKRWQNLDSKSPPDLIKEVFQRDNLEADLLLDCFASSRERSEGLADSQHLGVLLSEWLSRDVSQTQVQATAWRIRKWSSCCLKGERCFTWINTHSILRSNMQSLAFPLMCQGRNTHS